MEGTGENGETRGTDLETDLLGDREEAATNGHKAHNMAMGNYYVLATVH